MSDQQPNPDDQIVQDTSATDTPTGDVTEQPTIPDGYVPEERYKEAQSWGTKASQEAAQYRQLVEALHDEDPDTRAYAAQVLGIELAPAQEYLDDEGDPTAELRRELEDLKQWREQTQTAAQQEQTTQRDVQVIGTGLQSLAEKIGRDLTEEEIQLLGDAAWANRDDQGLPNINKVIELYTGVRTHDQKTWAKAKRQAPFVSSSGQAATQAPDLDDPQQRVAWMAAQLDDLDSAS